MSSVSLLEDPIQLSLKHSIIGLLVVDEAVALIIMEHDLLRRIAGPKPPTICRG